MKVVDVIEYRVGSSSWYTVRPSAPFPAASMAAWISDSRVDAAYTADSSLPVAIPSALSWS